MPPVVVERVGFGRPPSIGGDIKVVPWPPEEWPVKVPPVVVERVGLGRPPSIGGEIKLVP